MSDANQNNEIKRPNKNYKLSNENANIDGLVFHYNRERRLENAPQNVRDLYKTSARHRFNLLKPLVQTRPLAMMFAAIVVASLLILIITILGLASDSFDLDGNQVSVRAIKYEGAVIMIVKKTIKKSVFKRFNAAAAAYTGAVDIAVQPVLKSAIDQDLPSEDIFFHKIFFTFDPEESYRFTIPFESDELAVVLSSEKKTIGITIKTE